MCVCVGNGVEKFSNQTRKGSQQLFGKQRKPHCAKIYLYEFHLCTWLYYKCFVVTIFLALMEEKILAMSKFKQFISVM